MAPPSARPRSAGASASDAALSRALVRALGEFAASARRPRRRHGAQAAAERQAVASWLRGRSAGELASLCSVEDSAFVKTVLSMAMAGSRLAGRLARLGNGQAAEFQLLPAHLKPAVRRRRAGEAAQATQTQAARWACGCWGCLGLRAGRSHACGG